MGSIITNNTLQLILMWMIKLTAIFFYLGSKNINELQFYWGP